MVESSSCSSDSWIGRLIGDHQRYRLEKHLDSGGMGKVFLATDMLLGQQVALKLLQDTLAEAGDLRKRFEREIFICAALSSEHVVQVRDYGITAEGLLFYVMEYLRGETLGQLLRREKRLSVERTVKIIRQVCAGLQLAHEGITLWRDGTTISKHIKVVHSDLKPSNIFLVPTYLGELVKIIDFGIAKLWNDATKYKNLTSIFQGTFRYAAPEQLQGAPIDGQADIYSLGIILYEMLSGSDPFGFEVEALSGIVSVTKAMAEAFRSATEVKWGTAHLSKQPQPLRSQPGCEHLPAELEAIVMRCLQKAPVDRFACVGELSKALQAVMAVESESSTGIAQAIVSVGQAGQVSDNTTISQSPSTWDSVVSNRADITITARSLLPPTNDCPLPLNLGNANITVTARSLLPPSKNTKRLFNWRLRARSKVATKSSLPLNEEHITVEATIQTQAQLLRYPNLDCPDQTILNRKFSLFVQILIEQPELSAQAIYIEDTDIKERLPEVEVVLRVHCFDIEASNTRTLQVEREGDSEVRFVLIPRQLGEQQLRVDFYQHGRRIGTARRNVLVVEEQVDANVFQPNLNSILELKTVSTLPPPDLELCVELHAHSTLNFTLHSTKATVGYHHTRIGEVTLKGSPLEKMQAVYQELSRLAAPIKLEEQAMAERRLSVLGNRLWDELIPNNLKQEYWRFKSRVKTVLITSDEPWTPWEAVKPYRYNDDGEREDDPFWCQQFALSRWLSGPSTADELLVGSVRPIAPFQINLLSLQEEVAFVKQLSSLRNGITALEPFSTCLEVLNWLETEEFLLLHFACHGMFDATSPDNSAIKLSDGVLRPSDIRARFGGRRLRPLIFINACHGARTEFSFTGLGGWAERLVEARVGAFVGAMWEVNDSLALRFARRFYTGLLKESETIAEAFRQAREEIRRLAPYNSTWLAYSLYADPEGRIQDVKAAKY